MLSKNVVKRLVEIEKRVSELNELLKRVELEKEALARFKLKIGDKPSVKQFEQLRVLTNINTANLITPPPQLPYTQPGVSAFSGTLLVYV